MSRWDALSDLDYYDACRWPRPATVDGPRTALTSEERATRQTAEIAHKLARGYPKTQISIVPQPKKDIA